MGKEFALDTELNAISEISFGTSDQQQGTTLLDDTLAEFTSLYKQLQEKYSDNDSLILIKLVEIAQNKNSKLFSLIEKL